MPIITSIKSQKNKKRVNIYLDDKFGFGIDLDNFVLLRLKVNQELSDEEVTEIVKKSEFQKTLDKLLMWATLRPRSKKEVDQYFKRKKVHESLEKELLERLDHLKLINDEEFARWWVDQRLEFKSKSVRDITQELRVKGIGKEIIEKVLGGSGINEEKNARDLIEKKMYKWRNLEPRSARQKMSQYLSGKGFGWGVIKSVVEIED